MEKIEGIISGHPFFKDFEDRYLEFIIEGARKTSFDIDEIIHLEGGDANYFYIILDGKVSVETHDHKQGLIIIQTLGKGDLLGWSWIFPPYRWHFDARALEKTTALVLDGRRLRIKCEEEHDLGYELIKRVANIIMERLHATSLQLLDVYGMSRD